MAIGKENDSRKLAEGLAWQEVTRMAISDRSHRHQAAGAPVHPITRCTDQMNDDECRIWNTDRGHQCGPLDQDRTAENLAAQFGNFGIRMEDGYGRSASD